VPGGEIFNTAVGSGALAVPEKLIKSSQGMGRAKIYPLALGATQTCQEIILIPGFYPFGDHPQIQGLHRGQDGFDYRRVILVQDDIPNEGSFDFKNIDGKAFQICQR
jgi:hypothetical protein